MYSKNFITLDLIDENLHQIQEKISSENKNVEKILEGNNNIQRQ